MDRKKIQPEIEFKTYTALQMVKTKEKSTISEVVDKALKAYIEKNYKELYKTL